MPKPRKAMENTMDYEMIAKKILEEHMYSYMAAGVVKFSSPDEYQDFMIREVSLILVSKMLTKELKPLELNEVRNCLTEMINSYFAD